MPFAKIVATAQTYPRRHWALVGFPNTGKSTFAAQMRGPILAIDADQRFAEVAHLAPGDVFALSETGMDNTQPERIADILRANIHGSGIRSVVVDSLTAIMAPIVSQAIMANDAGRNKNQMAAWKTKALGLRLLQDAVTAAGLDSLWIWHFQRGRDDKAQPVVTSTISQTELARLRRSLNLHLEIVVDGTRRGVKVIWARRGRAGVVLWDDSGHWAGMPERIEAAVYDGLSVSQQERIEGTAPAAFDSPAAAWAWGQAQGVFRDEAHARNAYQQVKDQSKPLNALEMRDLWVAEVEERRRNVSRETMKEEAQGEIESAV